MHRFEGKIVGLLAIAALACACAGEPPPSAATVPPLTPSPPPERVPESAPQPPVVGEVPADLVEKLRADLARQPGVDAQDARVIRAESVTWPNGGLGCPTPGEMYTQSTEPGYLVEFRAGARVYSYHATRRGYFKLCPQPSAKRPPPRAAPTTR